MLSNHNQNIQAFLNNHQDDMTNMLARMVEYESPSDLKPSLDLFSSYLIGELGKIGADIEIIEQSTAGNHICARWGAGGKGVLMLAHMDTVWDVGTIAQRPIKIESGRLYGPGSQDMKGGIVIAIWAMRVLVELDLLKKPVTLLLTSDEEIGSETSRPVIEKEALNSEAVYVLEPAHPPLGSYKTSRKGVGEYKITVTGLAAHAGADHAKGVNAIEELAHQVISVQGFTNY